MNVFQNFYRDLFFRTKGYVFNWPTDKKLKIGDFFVLRPGGMGIIGNIYERYFQLDFEHQYHDQLMHFDSPVLEPFLESNDHWHHFVPPEDLWYFKQGCKTKYRSKVFLEPHDEKIDAAAVNTYTAKLAEPGSYFFSASSPHYFRMPHFIKIHKEIIRRLTTQFYNFRDVYLITEVCMANDFSIGVSHKHNAELVISTADYYEGDLVELLMSEGRIEVEKTNGLSYVKFREKGGVIAFKAMKMGLSLKARESITDMIYNSAVPEIYKYSVEMINHDLFHFFPSIEINPGNANEYFSWSDMTQEDVSQLVDLITF